MSDKPRVLLIDLSALFHPAWRANENGPVSVAFEATTAGVRRCISATPGALVAVCCDGKGNWRKTLAPSYKAQREALPSAFYGEMDRVKAALRADGLLLWQVDGFEADDLIATAALAACKLGHDVRVASNDKDMLQLVSTNCDYLSTRTFDVMDSHAVKEKFGVAPGYIRDFLALWGDKSDGVAGAPGIGAVRAAALLNEFHDIDTIYHKLDNAPDALGRPDSAIVKGLREGRESVALAVKLVSLRFDAPITFAEIYAERTPDVLPVGAEMEEIMSDHDTSGEPYDPTSPANIAAHAEARRNRTGCYAPGASDDPDKDSSPATDATTIESAAPSVALTPPPVQPEPAPLDDVGSRPLAAASEDSTALVRLDYTQQLEPRSFKELVLGCRLLWNAKIYQKYPTPESMVGAALRGREMGYGLGASLDLFHVMDVRGVRSLAMHAHAIIDRCMRDPDCEYFECVKSTSEMAAYEVKRRSRTMPFAMEYTIEQARRANLVKPGGNWELRPAEQLRKTCGVQAGRVIFPGAAMGLYCMEEMGD